MRIRLSILFFVMLIANALQVLAGQDQNKFDDPAEEATARPQPSKQRAPSVKPSLEELMAKFAEHEARYLPFHISYLSTFRMSDGISDEIRQQFPWGDGNLHGREIEVAQAEPLKWMTVESAIVNHEVQSTNKMVCTTDGIYHFCEPGVCTPYVAHGDFPLRFASASPLLGIFPLRMTWPSKGVLLSEYFAEDPSRFELTWDGPNAVLTVECRADETFQGRYKLWLADQYDWHPIRMQRFLNITDPNYFDEWEATAFYHSTIGRQVRSGEIRYRDKGTFDRPMSKEPENPDHAQQRPAETGPVGSAEQRHPIAYSIEFEVGNSTYGSKLNESLFAIAAPNYDKKRPRNFKLFPTATQSSTDSNGEAQTSFLYRLTAKNLKLDIGNYVDLMLTFAPEHAPREQILTEVRIQTLSERLERSVAPITPGKAYPIIMTENVVQEIEFLIAKEQLALLKEATDVSIISGSIRRRTKEQERDALSSPPRPISPPNEKQNSLEANTKIGSIGRNSAANPANSLDVSNRQSVELTYHNLETAAVLAARDYRTEASQQLPDPKALTELKQKLDIAVKAAFEAQMNLQQIRLQIAQKDLAEVQAKHQRRMTLAEKIIERRIADLMNDEDLEWADKKNAAEPKMPDKEIGQEPNNAEAAGATNSSEKVEILEQTSEHEESELPRISKTEIVLPGLRATISRLAATPNVGDKFKVFVELKNESDGPLEEIETRVQFQNSAVRILAASPIARFRPHTPDQENSTVVFKSIKSVAPGETIQMSLVYCGEESTPHTDLHLILKDTQHSDGQVLTLPVSVADADIPASN